MYSVIVEGFRTQKPLNEIALLGLFVPESFFKLKTCLAQCQKLEMPIIGADVSLLQECARQMTWTLCGT